MDRRQFLKTFSDEEEQFLAREFPLLRDPTKGCVTYLDNAGAALYSQSQMNKIHQDLTSHLFPNPHTHFGEAVQGRDDINSRVLEARQLVLRFFNTDSSQYQVIFTTNATAAMKIVAENFAWASRNINCGKKSDNSTTIDSSLCKDSKTNGGTTCHSNNTNNTNGSSDVNKSAFVYLDECHTSAVGLRQFALTSGAEIFVASYEDLEATLTSEAQNFAGPNLVAFPAMSNFCGRKFPIKKWIQISRQNRFKVLLDAAAFVSTSPLDLTKNDPDFVTISFYKIFGYPTGLGALLVNKRSTDLLSKSYFGGGTVEMNLVREPRHVGKPTEAQFEDGTIPFLSVASLKFGFEAIGRLGMHRISEQTFNLAKYFHDRIRNLKHSNGNFGAKIYSSTTSFDDVTVQGAIVNFNLLRPDGGFFGFSEFSKVALHNNIVVRAGCFCNIGACQKYLNGKPTGSIRISFGYFSTKSDADKVIDVIIKNFIDIGISTQSQGMPASDCEATISAIYLFPIKSCAPIKVENWPLDSGSLLYDRKFLIMHGGSPLTQKSFPALCLLRPEIDLDQKLMTLHFDNFSPIRVQIRDDSEAALEVTEVSESFPVCIGKVCGDSIRGFDCGQEVSEWLEDITGLTGLKLVQLVTRNHRKPKSESSSADLQTFANEAQFLVINRASCKALKVESSDPDWLVEQFRGNLVVDGVQPFEEDEWKYLHVAGDDAVCFRADSLCTRCTIIGLDQKTGQKVDKDQDPISALTKRSGQRFKFGILANLTEHFPTKSRNLSVGTKLTIIRKEK